MLNRVFRNVLIGRPPSKRARPAPGRRRCVGSPGYGPPPRGGPRGDRLAVETSCCSLQAGPCVETTDVDEEDDGRFQLKDLEALRLRLVAASPGHGVKALSLSLEPGEARDVGELVLEPGADPAHD